MSELEVLLAKKDELERQLQELSTRIRSAEAAKIRADAETALEAVKAQIAQVLRLEGTEIKKARKAYRATLAERDELRQQIEERDEKIIDTYERLRQIRNELVSLLGERSELQVQIRQVNSRIRKAADELGSDTSSDVLHLSDPLPWHVRRWIAEANLPRLVLKNRQKTSSVER